MAKYLLVDFMNMAFRAHYAYAAQASFTNAEGTPTGMSYGLLSMVLSAIRDARATHVALASESRSRTHNATLVETSAASDPTVATVFPMGYKGGRKEMDPLLRVQLDMAEEACEAMGWPIYRSEGYEADDTLASLAHELTAAGHKVVIVTGDRDLWQCVSDSCVVWAPRKGGTYNEISPVTVSEHLGGLRADQIIEYKALAGDSSDGYPGCPGIGSVGALKLLTEYDSVEGVYAHIDEIKGAMQRRLIDNKALVELSRKLAQLEPNAPVALNMDLGQIQTPYPAQAASWVQKQGMKSLMPRIGHEEFFEDYEKFLTDDTLLTEATAASAAW